MTTRERVLDVLANAVGCFDHQYLVEMRSSGAGTNERITDALLAAGLIATPEERECVEACVAWRKGHNDIGQMDFNTLVDRKLCAAVDALLAARAPNPAWRVDERAPWRAFGLDGSSRQFFTPNGSADPETCAREVARLNAEAK